VAAEVPERFERDWGCTEAEWLRWLPGAVGSWPWKGEGRQAQVQLHDGVLRLQWHRLPERRLGLAVIPRLAVCFEFEGVSPALRHTFMQRFDLHTQRGGG
jgi:hypothetical protein